MVKYYHSRYAGVTNTFENLRTALSEHNVLKKCVQSNMVLCIGTMAAVFKNSPAFMLG